MLRSSIFSSRIELNLCAGLLGIAACLFLLGCPDSSEQAAVEEGSPWNASELAILRSLSLSSLGAPPPAPSNRVADEPRAARLGKRLFFDPRLSLNGRVACSTCHDPRLYFTDQRAKSQGLGTTQRNAPTVVGAAFSPWQFWDGRRDSLWSQALAPIETASEMGSSRLAVVRYVTQSGPYAADYRALFGAFDESIDLEDRSRFPEHGGPYAPPASQEAWARLSNAERDAIDQAFANIGKSLAAYERTLLPDRSRFDRYVAALTSGSAPDPNSELSEDQRAGLRLFLDVGRTRCLQCHNGPLFTNNSFHDVGTGRRSEEPDLGRFLGIQALRLDPFNCLGPWSDAPPERCESLRFLDARQDPRLIGSFRTPGLRGLTKTAPYFHDGGLPDLAAVIEHYRSPPSEPPNELTPIDLDENEARQLIDFLETLSVEYID